MAEPKLTQEMKRHAVIVSLAAGHTDFEIAAFLKVARSFIFKIRRELESASGDVATVSYRKRPEFITSVQDAIEEDPGKSMRALSRELQVDEATIRRAVHEDLHCKSYVMQRGQFMSGRTVTRAKHLLNNLKHPEQPGMLWFFSDEKNFFQDQKVNCKNDRWLCKTPEEVLTVMHTEFPTSVMVLGVVKAVKVT